MPIMPIMPITVGHPSMGCGDTIIDLDDLTIIANREPNDKTDLKYNSCGGLSKYVAQFVGPAPVSSPRRRKTARFPLAPEASDL